MLTPTTLLERLTPLSSVEGYSTAKAMLEAPGAQLRGKLSEGRVTVGSVLDIWSYRLARSQTGEIGPVLGLAHLVDALRNLQRETLLKLFLVENDGLICVFWFNDQTNTPVSLVVYDAGTAKEPKQS